MAITYSDPDTDTDADIADIAALTPSNGDMLYWATGGTRYNTTSSQSYGRSLLNTASELAFKTLANLEAVDEIKVTSTNATLTALTAATGLIDNGLYQTLGRASERDGGQGLWVYDSASTSTANTGTILAIDGGGAGRFFRVYNGPMFIEWFGGSSDWGAALTAMWTAVASAGGVAAMSPGGDYTFTTQAAMPATENNVTWDIRGCKLRPKYASGATFKFGDGVTQSQELTILGGSTIIDADSLAGGGVSQAVFEFRGMRSVRIHDVRGSNFHQICKWGDASDSVTCFNLWIDQCDITMRSTTHTHGILANGGSGGIHIINGTSIEADATNVASGVNLIELTSSQGPARLDHVVFSGGAICKGWDRICSAVDARIVNIESDPASRFDEVKDAAFYFETTSGATKGGIDVARLSGTCSIGKFLRIKADKASSTISFEDIIVSEVIHGEAVGSVVHVTSSGTGLVKALHVKGLHSADSNPADASQDCIILDADLDECLIDQVTIQHKSGASYNYRYGIYNNTASTKSVRITKNITMDVYNTGVVYDPNIGDISINRWCEIRQDGTPRLSHNFRFAVANLSASATNALVGVENATISTKHVAPARGRVIGNTIALSGTIAADTVTAGLSQAGAVSANFDAAFTSGSGADPVAAVDYAAGSSAYAAGDAIQFRVTTGGSLSPTTIDFLATATFLEM